MIKTLFYQKKMFDQNFILNKIFLWTKIFLTKNCFRLKLFFDQQLHKFKNSENQSIFKKLMNPLSKNSNWYGFLHEGHFSTIYTEHNPSPLSFHITPTTLKYQDNKMSAKVFLVILSLAMVLHQTTGLFFQDSPVRTDHDHKLGLSCVKLRDV